MNSDKHAPAHGTSSAHSAQSTRASKLPSFLESINSVRTARVIFIVTVAILLLFGLVMVYSASSIVALGETGDPSYYFKRQLMFVVLGLVLAVGVAIFHYHVPSGKISWIIWGVVVVLLVATLIYGATGLGAKRWIPVAGITIQPSELVKIAFLFVGVHLLTKWRESGFSGSLLLWAAVGLGVPILLVLAQPDLGTVIVALIGVIVILWLGGVSGRICLAAIGAMVLVGVLAILLEPYRLERIFAALDPWADPLDTGYQTINSLYAFGEGGITGVGLGQSHQKYLFIPEPQNDFVFAIIGEELGLIGAFVTVLLFMVFIVSGFMIAHNAADLPGKMIALSATMLIGFQAFLNILCVVGVVPITGKPLPFFSAGGSSMISTMILVGAILSVSFHTDARDVSTQRRDNLVIIEGGRKQGTRVPGVLPQSMERQRVASVAGVRGAVASAFTGVAGGRSFEVLTSAKGNARSMGASAQSSGAGMRTSSARAQSSSISSATGASAGMRSSSPLTLSSLSRNRTGLAREMRGTRDTTRGSRPSAAPVRDARSQGHAPRSLTNQKDFRVRAVDARPQASGTKSQVSYSKDHRTRGATSPALRSQTPQLPQVKDFRKREVSVRELSASAPRRRKTP